MFTGIVSGIGRIISISRDQELTLQVATKYDPETIKIGASIACSGVCLTVVDTGRENGTNWFSVDVSGETLASTTLGEWKVEQEINLERSLMLSEELGGHLVSGHVDGVGRVVSVADVGASTQLGIELPTALKRYVARKGSIAVDGVSLTINDVNDCKFDVNVIPHTLSVTTLGAAATGSRVNIEVDMLARYVARMRDIENE